MTSPKRLASEGSPLDRTLLRAGREDRPSRDLERRLTEAVGAVPAAQAASAGPRPSLFAQIGRSRGFVLAAVLGVGAAVMGVVTRDASSVSHSGAPEGVPQKVADKPALAEPKVAPGDLGNLAPKDEAPSEIAPSPIAVSTPDALPSVRPAPRQPEIKALAARPAEAPPATRDAVTAPAAPDGRGQAASPSLEREVELLDTVKDRLKSGSFTEAGRALGTYDAEFPQGLLRPEAGLLRVRVLLAKGDKAGARTLAEDLLRRHPNSVHAKRIRALLAADGGF